MEYTDYYKFPLKKDEHSTFMVWTNDVKRAFDFATKMIHDNGQYLSDEEKSTIVSILNGESKVFVDGVNLSYSNSDIFNEENGVKKLFISIRGWGSLTGTGAMGLKPDVAAKMQDDFAAFIIDKLTVKKFL